MGQRGAALPEASPTSVIPAPLAWGVRGKSGNSFLGQSAAVYEKTASE
jgi:hypothetical protein